MQDNISKTFKKKCFQFIVGINEVTNAVNATMRIISWCRLPNDVQNSIQKLEKEHNRRLKQYLRKNKDITQ